jgi:long-chain acyl-CoA synthetase
MTQDTITSERASIDAAVEGKTVVDVLDRNANEYADMPAVHWKDGEDWKHLTWSAFRRVVHEAAAGLHTLGVGKGDFVAIMASNRPEHVIADLAAVHAGGAGVSFYSTLAQPQIAYIASHCRAKVAVLEDLSYMKRWEAIKSEIPQLQYVVLIEGAENYDTVDWVLSWDDLIERGRKALASDAGLVERMVADRSPSDLATLIYTSGTTGTPKGVSITHRNVLWTAESLKRRTKLPNNVRGVSYLPLAHIAERMATYYSGLYLPGEIYYCPDLTQVLDYIQKARPQLFFGVPRVWEKFHARLMARFEGEDERRRKLIFAAIGNARRHLAATQEGKKPPLGVAIKHRLFDKLIFSKVRHGLGMDQAMLAVTGAAPINPDLLTFFRALGIPLHEVYGMSEDTGPATLGVPGADKIGSVGRPLPGVEVRLAEDGEILIRGGIVAAGYYKMAEETAETFDKEGWLHSGDLGRFDDDGFLYIVGRKKEIIINAAGKNIAPAKLETMMKNHPLVSQACMIGDGRQYLTMLIALDPEEAPGWAAKNRLTFTDLASFSKMPAVREEIDRAVNNANEQVARVEQIKKFSIVPDEWTPDSGEITPSLKLKRRVVLDRYVAQIDEMYS